MTIDEHLENLWKFFDYKREEGKFYVDDLMLFNLEWICLKWPILFPDLLYIYEQIEAGNKHYVLVHLAAKRIILIINLEVLRRKKNCQEK